MKSRRPASRWSTTRLARQDATGQSAQARVQLASALGLPLRALDGVKFSFAGLDQFPQNLTAPEVRRDAILNRADVRGALADYAASQSALQLEIAKQYPDLHLGPGYELDQTDNKWSLGVSLDLPILNHNQGPVAEAKANRTAAAAHFLTVQTTAIAEIDSALAGYDAALKKSATAKTLLDDMQKQLDSVHAQAQAGEVEPLTAGERRSRIRHRRAKPVRRARQGAGGARPVGGRGAKSVDAAAGNARRGAEQSFQN